MTSKYIILGLIYSCSPPKVTTCMGSWVEYLLHCFYQISTNVSCEYACDVVKCHALQTVWHTSRIGRLSPLYVCAYAVGGIASGQTA